MIETNTVDRGLHYSGLCDAFAEIEKEDATVNQVKMHPDLKSNFYFDTKSDGPFIEKEGTTKVFGAKLKLDENMPKNKVTLSGQDSENTLYIVHLKN